MFFVFESSGQRRDESWILLRRLLMELYVFVAYYDTLTSQLVGCSHESSHSGIGAKLCSRSIDGRRYEGRLQPESSFILRAASFDCDAAK